MIAVDTSALMAIVLGEAEADACIAILESETEVLISASRIPSFYTIAKVSVTTRDCSRISVSVVCPPP